MNIPLLNKLYTEGLLTAASVEKIRQQPLKRLFSVHWELRTILYLGIMVFTGGLAIVVYKNIDSIGHQFILLFIALLSAGSFFYSFKKKLPFSTGKVEAPNAFFDYILLLGCLTFLTFLAYFQYQYHIFGNRYGLATCIPMLVLFFVAYYFDHIGILSLAITNLGAWLGIAVAPMQLLQGNDFNDATIIITGIFLGIILVVTALLSARRNLKAHFAFTYINFGIHILFVSAIAAMFFFNELYLLWFLFILALGSCFYFYSKKEKSFYLLLVATLYTYAALSYVVVKLLFDMGSGEMIGIYLSFFYFIGSAVGLVLFLIRTNKTLKTT